MSTFLDGKKLNEIVKVVETKKVKTPLALTKTEKLKIMERLRLGESFSSIKKNFKRVETNDDVKSYRSASLGQIAVINSEWENKIKELTPCNVCGKAPCVCKKEEVIIEEV